MKTLLTIVLAISPCILLGNEMVNPKKSNCLSTKEYITSLNYLRDQKEFKLKDKKSQMIAQAVSKGCSGSAKSFIKITELLINVKVDTATAIKTGVEFANLSPKKSENFINIFKRTYEKKYFDMSLKKSLDVSRKLSINFEGDIDLMYKDFKILTNFCVNEEGLVNNKSKCADFAAKVAVLTGEYEKNMSEPFIDLYKYLSSDSNGPKLPTYKAIELAHQSIIYGPFAYKNFKQAFEYGMSDKGLKLKRDKSVAFALSMAKESSKRVPASKN